jgi:malonate-semialdehyde dehydrogenase (acetylating)/methylmalonate-semialdehyde dehydrogenase
MPDANLDQTIKQLMGASFGAGGQRCMAAPVVVLVGDVADKFIPKLMKKANEIRIGNGSDKGIDLGPVIREENKVRTEEYIEIGKKEGAVLLRDGREDAKLLPAGYFIGPTIFDHVTPEMTIWKEELFAPVLAIMRANTLEEAISFANASEFANGACIYTDSGAAVRTFRETVDAGMLGVNLGVPAPMAFFPFSGYKRSFFGDLHANGSDGVEFYTRKKMITTRW